MHGRVITIICGLFMAGGSLAQSDLSIESMSGFRYAANTLMLKASSDPRNLPAATTLEEAEKVIVEESKKIMNAGSTRAAVLSRKGRILSEQYSRFVSPESTPFAFSISKSLVAVAVGKALCDGSIKSLDDKAEAYATDLKGSSYGDSSIKQLLMMASGAYQGDLSTGHPNGNESFVLRNMYLPQGLDVDLVSRMKKFSGYAAPGTGFSYKNYDTQALVYVVEAATKTDFGTYFEKNIWEPVKAEKPGAWLRDSKKTVIGFAGFSATPKDYVRLGYFLIDEMKKEGSCMANYLATATSNLNTSAQGRGYGYQIHKLSLRLAPESFWFVGYGGQLLGVDVRSETVLYTYSVNENQIPAWVRATATMMGQLK